MTTSFGSAARGIATALAPEGAHAADAHHAFLGVPDLVWKTLNLALFLALLVYLLRKPIAKFFGDRRGEVAATLERAEQNRARAEALAAELGEKVSRLESELAELRAKAERDARADQEALLAEADAEAKKLVERTRHEIESRVRAARAELTAYAGDLSIDLARDLLEKSVTADDQRRLLQEGLVALAGRAAPRA